VASRTSRWNGHVDASCDERLPTITLPAPPSRRQQSLTPFQTSSTDNVHFANRPFLGFTTFIRNGADQNDRAHYGEIERTWNIHQVDEISKHLQQRGFENNSDNRTFTAAEAAPSDDRPMISPDRTSDDTESSATTLGKRLDTPET
jgi:hypothetical protein